MIKTRFIFNPRAGKSALSLFKNPSMRLNDIYVLLDKYGIEFEAAPSEKPGDVLRLASEAVSEGYERVIVAGGDGTVGEAANALVGTDTVLGIIPSGTYMNMARMLSIPRDPERAVMLLCMGQTRSIDAGELVEIQAEEVAPGAAAKQWHFFESVGIGVDADYQKNYLRWKQGDITAIFSFLAAQARRKRVRLSIELDEGRRIDADSHLVTVSNGPYMGAGIAVAETAKLNDRLLTVRVYRMSRLEIFLNLLMRKAELAVTDRRIDTYFSKSARITAPRPQPVHADGRIFGQTPVSLEVRPNALKVITGFPDPAKEPSLTESRPGTDSYIN